MKIPAPPKTILVLLFALILKANAVKATEPVVTVRFANPNYVCATQTYSLDVEFQCDTAGQQLFGMNVRFFYPDNLLEFVAFDEFIDGYGTMIPYPPAISTGGPSSGMALFGFSGPQEFVNGAIKKTSEDTVYLSTTGWTKIFAVKFHVDDPAALNSESFCPPVIWDLNEAGNGGMAIGFVITLVVSYPNFSKPAMEHCQQFNWQYDGIPGLPHGYPVATDCINTICAYAPKTFLPVSGSNIPGLLNVPVTVTEFDSIKGFNLVFEYDPAVIAYLSHTANEIFNPTNGDLSVTDSVSSGGNRKITLAYDGNIISLADNSQLTDLQFNYITGSSALSWLPSGNHCYYIDRYNIPAYDHPFSDYYHNGKIISLDAPITRVDTTYASDGNYFTFTVRVWNFINILSGHLTLNYDPLVLDFMKAIPNAEISSSFITAANVDGTLIIDWSNTPTSLDEGSVLMYLTFQYANGTTPLTWIAGGNSCQYINAELNQPLDDEPAEDHYFDGFITASEFIWTGAVSGDWNNPANWENNLVPVEPVDAVISPVTNPDYWPLIDGNFQVGEDCKNLIILNDAQLTISGNCMIKPGYYLEMNETSLLKTGGDWINSGSFTPGDGTVEFIGGGDSYITGGSDPAGYITSYQVNTFPAGLELTNGVMNGPSGNDEYIDVSIGFNFSYLGSSYSQARISTNGWISLNTGDTVQAVPDNMILFTSEEPTAVIAPWWDDLMTSAPDNIRYKTEGTAPDRVFIVEWVNVYAYRSLASAKLSFSVRLYETTNIIEFFYGNPVSGTHNPAESASIGIKDLEGGPGHFLEATQNSSYILLGALNSLEHWPMVNYRFTPIDIPAQEVFNHLINNKTGGNLFIQKDVVVSGTN